MATPTPVQDRKIWIQCQIGPHVLGGGGKRGTAIVKARSGQTIDKKQAPGKDKAKSSRKGRNLTPFEILLTAHHEEWPYYESILETIDPNSPEAGGPYTFDHPDTRRRKAKTVMVEDVGEVEWLPGGHIFTVTISGAEWEEPKKTSGGAAKTTPTDAQGWVQTPHTYQQNSGFNRASGSVNQQPAATAYTGPAAPSAEP